MVLPMGRMEALVATRSAPAPTAGVRPRPARLSRAQVVQRLTVLKPLAAANRGPIAAGDPRRMAGEEYAWLLDLALRRGMTPGELARATGSDWSVLRARLARHGYRPGSPTTTPYRGPVGPPPVIQACRRGHLFDEANTYRYTDASGVGHRVCRRGRAERMRRRRAAAGVGRGPGTVGGGGIPVPGRLDMNGALDLVQQLTGRRPAAATLRGYLSRGDMPARGSDGRFDEQQLRQWLQRRRPRADAATVTRFQRLLAQTQGRSALARVVGRARRAHLTWADIGAPMALTRQQAHSRFAASIRPSAGADQRSGS